MTEPAQTESAVTGPAVTGPAVTGPAVTGPAVTGPAVTRSSVAAPTSAQVQPSGTATRVGWGLTVLVGAFLLFDAVTHLLAIQPVLDAFADLGFPAHLARGLGVLELLCLIAFLVPRTSVLGAVLLTGYLGGAVAAQVRIEAPLLSALLFPVYTGLMLWAGLYLRDSQVRALLPLRRAAP
jgi:hypothetical protein